MQTPDSRFRRWMAQWFGIDRNNEVGDQPVDTCNPGRAKGQQGPIFSLGDTKQDVVVSFRAQQSDKP